MDGILNISKEAGYTSHDVVAKLRGVLGQKKIGHTGTLDPMATGVLPVCLGKATKVCELLSDRDKTYRAVCLLGVVTDTQDMTGSVCEKNDTGLVTEEKLIDVAESFLGKSMQVPPMYSAVKVNGKKLYQLAREGKTVERKARQIEIKQIQILQIDLKRQTFSMEVTCSKGTYIRTLCHDIGKCLGVGAALKELTRTAVGDFLLADAITVSQCEALYRKDKDAFFSRLRPIDSLFPDDSRLQIRPEAKTKLANGNLLAPSDFLPGKLQKGENVTAQRFLVYDEKGDFRAIYQNTENAYRVIKMF